VRPPGYAGTLRHACSTAASGAAAGRAFEARPVADHGEVAALRTGIPFESLELCHEGLSQGGRRGFSDRDADGGRLGDVRRSDGWSEKPLLPPWDKPSWQSSRDSKGMPVRSAATSPWSATGRASNARPAAAPLAAVEHAWRSVPAYPGGLTVGDLIANHRRQLWLLRKRLRRRRLLRRRSSNQERA